MTNKMENGKLINDGWEILTSALSPKSCIKCRVEKCSACHGSGLRALGIGGVGACGVCNGPHVCTKGTSRW